MIWGTNKSLFNSNQSKQKTGKQQALLEASGLLHKASFTNQRRSVWEVVSGSPPLTNRSGRASEPPSRAQERGGCSCFLRHPPPRGTTRLWSSLVPFLWLLFYLFQWFLHRTEELPCLLESLPDFSLPCFILFMNLFYFSLFAFTFFS